MVLETQTSSRDDEVFDALDSEQQFEVSMGERAAAWLVNHRFTWKRIKLRDNVVAGLAANEKPAERTRRADSKAGGVVV